jgi:hypothetical protein
MYSLKHASAVPMPGRQLRVGLPIYEHTIPNIAIVSANNSDPIHLNAMVLRAALLANPEVTEQLLGITVMDAYTRKIVDAPVPKETPTQPEPEKKVSKESKSKESKKLSKEEEEWV